MCKCTLRSSRHARGGMLMLCASCWSMEPTATSCPSTKTQPCTLPRSATIWRCVTSSRTISTCEYLLQLHWLWLQESAKLPCSKNKNILILPYFPPWSSPTFLKLTIINHGLVFGCWHEIAESLLIGFLQNLGWCISKLHHSICLYYRNNVNGGTPFICVCPFVMCNCPDTDNQILMELTGSRGHECRSKLIDIWEFHLGKIGQICGSSAAVPVCDVGCKDGWIFSSSVCFHFDSNICPVTATPPSCQAVQCGRRHHPGVLWVSPGPARARLPSGLPQALWGARLLNGVWLQVPATTRG